MLFMLYYYHGKTILAWSDVEFKSENKFEKKIVLCGRETKTILVKLLASDVDANYSHNLFQCSVRTTFYSYVQSQAC